MLQKVYSSLFPPTCILCDAQTQTDLDICKACFTALPHNHHCCATCALPLSDKAHPDKQRRCGNCLVNKPLLAGSIVPYIYEPPTDYIVHRLKYNSSMKFGRLMGELLANAVTSYPRPDFLIPVPQHPERHKERGIDHAAVIAVTLGRKLSIAVDQQLVFRRDSRPAQSGLSARERQTNMRSAFATKASAPARHAAVVDDVMTTGATAEAMTRALLSAGCHTVSLWAFARTL